MKHVYIVRMGTRPNTGGIVGVYSTKHKAIGAIKRLNTVAGRFCKVPDIGNVYYAGELFWASWVPEPVDGQVYERSE